MGQDKHEGAQYRFRFAVDILAERVEVARPKKGMESETGTFGVIQMRNAPRKVQWSSHAVQEVILSEIFNGESEIVKNSVLHLWATKADARV